MWCFSVHLSNDSLYQSEGLVSKDFYVQAEDMVSAIIKASDITEKLRTELKSIKFPDWQTLRLKHVREEYEIVGGIGFTKAKEDDNAIDKWIVIVARKASKDLIK